LPDSPGVYQFLNDEGKIIYVGKAKNLKKRISTYFNKTNDSYDTSYSDRTLNNLKMAVMVRKIADIHTIVVETESDALLLENNMIKEYKPRYNILLKDDKSFPWIVVRNEKFPRVYLMRNPVQDGSLYFGPYTSIPMVRTLLDLVKKLYSLRSCHLNIKSGKKYKVCLEYHIGNCKAPCVGQQSEDEYNESISQVCNILRGNITTVIKHLKKLMKEYAEVYRFEEAEAMKKKIEMLEKYRSKSTIVNPTINNVDVFSFEDDINCAYVNCLRIVDGAIIQAQTIEIVKRLDEHPSLLLGYAITDIRKRFSSQSSSTQQPGEIIVPFYPDVLMPDIVYTIPENGDKKELLKLSQRNALFFQLEKKKQIEKTDPERHINRILQTLQHDLQMSELPVHIECFDNSNIQGTNSVAACVVFRNARPSKKEYRHYIIRTVEGPNDFASMQEVVYRRYRRLLDENESLPKLIIIDGGKGQLSSAMNSLEKLGLSKIISIISIAERLEEIYFPDDSMPIYLDKRSESLKLIQQLRDEAHRFGNLFHRNKRSQAMLHSELNEIKGIGEKTAKKLLQQFKSVAQLRTVPVEEIEKSVGKRKAQVLTNYFSLCAGGNHH